MIGNPQESKKNWLKRIGDEINRQKEGMFEQMDRFNAQRKKDEENGDKNRTA